MRSADGRTRAKVLVALVGHTTLVAPFDQTAVAHPKGESDGHDPAC